MRKRFQKQTHVGWYLFIVSSTAVVPLWMALTATLLIAIDFVFSAPGGSVWISQLNRSFAVIVVWACAVQMRLMILGRLHVEQRDWMRDAQSRLAERIIGEQSLGPVGRCISEFL